MWFRKEVGCKQFIMTMGVTMWVRQEVGCKQFIMTMGGSQCGSDKRLGVNSLL